MLCVKKIYRDELLHLALILSLLRVNPDSYLGYDVSEIGIGDLSNGTSWAHVHTETLIQRRLYIHPKSLDSVLLNYEQEVFDDLNALGRYNRINSHPYDVAAYHLNLDDGSTTSDPTLQSDFEAASIDSGQDSNASVSSPYNVDRPSTSDREEGTFLSLPHDLDEEPHLSTGDPHAAELTQEDMDLIEVLWKQDVDLGFSLDLFNSVKENGNRTEVAEDDLEKLKALQALKNDDNGLKLKVEEPDDDSCTGDDPWAGLAYTVDLETGEYVLKSERVPDELTTAGGCLTDEEPSALLDLPEFSLEEALQLVGLDEDSQELKPIKTEEEEPVSPLPVEIEDYKPETLDWSDDCEDELGILSDMIQTPQFHPPHPRAFQGRMPYSRTMSMEQRWQDLANLLSLPGDGSGVAHPFAHHHHHHHHHHNFSGAYNPDARSVLLHNATLAPPMGDLNSTSPYTMSSAVATSMNLTNSSEPMGDGGPTVGYKMDAPHDMMYFQNSTPEIPVNQTTEGFLSSILDEDLQLMDMAMNEGMYTMRMLESNTSNNATSVGTPPEERMDASSDSAVSSMGSERVSSLSDGEWMETGSDSGHMPADSYAMDYHASKYRPYDYSYSSRKHSTAPAGPADNSHRMPPMAQKKHQMFGKRSYFQNTDGSSLGSHGSVASMPPTPVPIKYEYGVETGSIAPGNAFGSPVEGAVGPKPPEMKYSCSMDFIRHHTDQRPSLGGVQHNHTYHLPPESTGAMHRPHARDKHKGRRSEEEHLNRDEKRARAMNVPITVNDIINLPMDEFNERLSKYDLSEAQLSLIRDIRRRGKNKVAAQNCRKRKLDQIITLADEVKDMRDRKLRLLQERDFMLSERQRVKEKFSQLYRHIFQALRDPDGNPYSSYEYSLQQSADGTVLLVPRSNTTMLEPDLTRPKHKEHEHQHKE